MLIDLQSVQLADLLNEIQRRCTLTKFIPYWADETLRTVAAALEMPLEKLIDNRSREGSAHWPRSIAIAVLRENKGRSWQQIAAIWGQTHGAAILAHKRVFARMKIDQAFRDLMLPLFLTQPHILDF